MYNIIGADQKEYGPISLEQVRQWVHEGRLNGNSRIQAAGSGDWRQLRDLAEFAVLFPSPASPPPIPFRPAPASGAANALAIWSFGLGLFTIICCQFLSPVAIILGALALSQIKKNPGQSGRGFAVAGIILGILSLLFAVLMVTIFLLTPGAFGNFQNMFPR
jgi:hypothetical protein